MKKTIAIVCLPFVAALLWAQSAKIEGSLTAAASAVMDWSTAGHTLPAIVVGSVGALPASGCKAGELAIVTAATVGQQIYENSGTGSCTWTQQTGGSSATAISQWIAPFGFIANNDGVLSPASGSAHVGQYFEINVPYPGAIFNYVTASPTGAVPGHVAWTLWDSTCTTAISTTNTITPSNNAVNNWTFAGNPLTVTPGKYFLMLTSDATTTQFYAAFTTLVGDSINAGESAGNYHIFTGNSSTGTTTLVPPASCGTRSSTFFAGGGGIPPSFVIH